MYNHILIRYGELALKKSNRNQFIKAVTTHIKRALAAYDKLTFESKGLRYYVILNGTDPLDVVEILKKIPGIYSFSLATRCESTMETILDATVEVMKSENYLGKTFKVETSRGDKNFPYTSPEITKEVSRNLFKSIEGLKADVHNPDITLDIEVRYEGTYIYTKTYYGMGGFPAGILGKGLLMISGGIDSVVAGYLSIKKGIEIEAVHFASPPYTSDLALQKVVDLLEKLVPYTSNQKINFHIVPFTDIQENIYNYVREDYCITIMRRMMYRIAEKLSEKTKSIAIINGESVGQVASQTIESMSVIGEVTKLPIIRPLVTFDKQDIIDIANKIDTFNISIRPHEDCCTVYVPRHPQIKPRLDVCIKEENKFNFEELINKAVEKTEHVTLNTKRKYQVVEDEIDIF